MLNRRGRNDGSNRVHWIGRCGLIHVAVVVAIVMMRMPTEQMYVRPSGMIVWLMHTDARM